MATSNSNYASSPVTVQLAPDGKNWKDWIKQISNYAAGDNAFAILDGATCSTYDHLDERYILQTLVNPNIRDTMTPDQYRPLLQMLERSTNTSSPPMTRYAAL
jgi:hypothetical protein